MSAAPDKAVAAKAREIWQKTHRDFRSKRGDAGHPSILCNSNRGSALISLHHYDLATLEQIERDRYITLPERAT